MAVAEHSENIELQEEDANYENDTAITARRIQVEMSAEGLYDRLDLQNTDDAVYEDLQIKTKKEKDLEKMLQSVIAVAVCLGMLCLLLLGGNIGQAVHYHSPSNSMTNDTLVHDYNQLKTNYDTLTLENTQLKTDHNNPTREKNHLTTNYNALKQEKDQLTTKVTTLTQTKDQLTTKVTTLTQDKDQLTTKVTNLMQDKNQLTSNNNNLRQENEQLKTKLTLVENQLTSNNNNLRQENEQLKTKLTLVENGKPCPSGWMKFGCSCYYKSTEQKTWEESRKQCQQRGAYLVIINSQEEQEFIRGLNQKSWIGLKRTEGKWTSWLDGTAVTTQYWVSGYPVNTEDRNCALYFPNEGWYNEKCSDGKRHYICEK